MPAARSGPDASTAARAAIAVGADVPGLRAALTPYAGSWVLLGTSVATLGPVDAVLAGLHELAGEPTLAEECRASARFDCRAMRAPWWELDVDTREAR